MALTLQQYKVMNPTQKDALKRADLQCLLDNVADNIDSNTLRDIIREELKEHQNAQILAMMSHIMGIITSLRVKDNKVLVSEDAKSGKKDVVKKKSIVKEEVKSLEIVKDDIMKKDNNRSEVNQLINWNELEVSETVDKKNVKELRKAIKKDEKVRRRAVKDEFKRRREEKVADICEPGPSCQKNEVKEGKVKGKGKGKSPFWKFFCAKGGVVLGGIPKLSC